MTRARLIGLAILLLATAALSASIAYRWGRSRPVEVRPPLPAEVIRETVVEQIEVPVNVPGPARVVERVEWKTREVEVPVETVREVTRWLERDDAELQARVSVHGWKFEGLDDSGQLAAGWRGNATCEVRSGEADWTRLVSEPFSLTESTAETTIEPGLAARLRGYRQAALAGYGTDGWGVGYRRRLGRSRFDWTVTYERDEPIQDRPADDRLTGWVGLSWGGV